MRKTARQLEQEIAHTLGRSPKPVANIPALRDWTKYTTYSFMTPVGRYAIELRGKLDDYSLIVHASRDFGGGVHELGIYPTPQAAAKAAAKHYEENF